MFFLLIVILPVFFYEIINLTCFMFAVLRVSPFSPSSCFFFFFFFFFFCLFVFFVFFLEEGGCGGRPDIKT